MAGRLFQEQRFDDLDATLLDLQGAEIDDFGGEAERIAQLLIIRGFALEAQGNLAKSLRFLEEAEALLAQWRQADDPGLIELRTKISAISGK